jgi:hypothetical protein
MTPRTALTGTLARLGPDAPLPVAARALAEAGVPVFPCVPGGKNPLIRDGHGFHDATTNLRQVASWWRQAPEANIGVPTGRASGVAVVDVDVHGVDGFAAFRRARRAGLVPGWEALVRSPMDGLHVYYPAADGEQPSWQAGTAGIDFRGDRGYIIVPPSRRRIDGETRMYRLASVSPTPGRVLDAAALRAFLDPPRPQRRFAPSGKPADREDARRLASWLGGQSTDRNLKLFWAACRLAEGNVPVADALDALVTVQQRDFGEREITRTVHSAYRTIATAPTRTTTGEPVDRFAALDAPAPAPTSRGLS